MMKGRNVVLQGERIKGPASLEDIESGSENSPVKINSFSKT